MRDLVWITLIQGSPEWNDPRPLALAKGTGSFQNGTKAQGGPPGTHWQSDSERLVTTRKEDSVGSLCRLPPSKEDCQEVLKEDAKLEDRLRAEKGHLGLTSAVIEDLMLISCALLTLLQ